MMYRCVVLIAVLCISVAAFPQEKQVRKLEKLSQKHKDEKVLILSEKYLKKYPNSAQILVFRSGSLLNQYIFSGKKDEKMLYDLLKTYQRSISADKKKEYCFQDQLFINNLKLVLNEKIVLNKEKSPKKAEYYADYLAIHLKDTIAQYWVFHPRPIVIQPLPADTVVAENRKNITPDFFKKPGKSPHRDSVVWFASRFIGTPYKWAGETPKGFDCSGFVLYVMRKFGYDFYHKTSQIAKLGVEIPIEEARKGDILVFGSRKDEKNYSISHVGIVAENNGDSRKVIHSVSRGVCLDDLKDGYWKEFRG
jgi:cell wall-associated NlpC family hydrolase